MSVRPSGSRPRLKLSWLGLASLGGGCGLIWLYFVQPHMSDTSSVIFPFLFLGAGGALIAWGLRSLSGDALAILRRLRHRASNQYSVRMPREAMIYGLILLVLCAGALLGGNNMLMLVFGLMAGPFVLNGQITLGILKRLTAERELPAQAAVGETFRVKLTLRNRKLMLSSWMVSVEDPIVGAQDELQAAALFVCVPPRSSREAYYEVRAARRGVYEFGPMRVVSRFPLGLMERSIELGEMSRLTVYPRIGRMLSAWRESQEASIPVSDSAWAASGVSSDEFHGLREYRAGDNPRIIHWRTTARRNQIMVREFQHSRRHDLLLAVDLWLPARPTTADRERVEMAVSFAASICVDHMQRSNDASIEFLIGGQELVHRSIWTGAAGLAEILELLAVADGGAAPGLAAAACEVHEHSESGYRKVLVTSRPTGDPAAAETADGTSRRRLVDAGFEVYESDPEHLCRYVEYAALSTGDGG